MDKRMFKSIMMLILFTVMLILVTVKIDYIMSTIRYIIIILNPLFIGFSIAFVLNRPNMFFIGIYKKLFGRIKRKKFIKPLAICSTYLALIIFCGVLIAFIIPQLTNSVKLFASNAGIYMSGFENYVNNTAQLLHVKNLDLSGLDNVFDSFVASIYDIVIGVIPNLMNITSGVVSVLFTIVLAFVVSIYLLSEKETLIRQMKNLTYAYLPKKIADKTSEISKLTATTFTRYVAFQMLEAVILGSLCFIGMLIFGFSYPLLISIMIAVTALIPVVGAYIGCVFSLLLLVMVSPIKAMWFILFFIILQQFEGNVIYPRVVGRSIGLPGILVLLAVIIGGSIFGFPGMILGVPIMSILYTILKQSVAERLSKRKNS